MHEESPLEGDFLRATSYIVKATGLSTSRFHELANQDVMKKKSKGKYWVVWSQLSYIEYLQSMSSSTAKGQKRTDTQEELDRERAEGQRIKNSISRKEWAPIPVLRGIIAATFGRATQILESQRPKLRQKYGNVIPAQALADLELDLKRISDSLAEIPLIEDDYDTDEN